MHFNSANSCMLCMALFRSAMEVRRYGADIRTLRLSSRQRCIQVLTPTSCLLLRRQQVSTLPALAYTLDSMSGPIGLAASYQHVRSCGCCCRSRLSSDASYRAAIRGVLAKVQRRPPGLMKSHLRPQLQVSHLRRQIAQNEDYQAGQRLAKPAAA